MAATGNAQATATTNGQTISATGGPGCSSTATLGSNSYAFASGPPCNSLCANVTVRCVRLRLHSAALSHAARLLQVKWGLGGACCCKQTCCSAKDRLWLASSEALV